ncbi:helix-turn-helix domain-containing protein [Amycolatopsis sp. NBC_01488]|uniref:helix-turn-helix domain-containing protein n=1 Tax=Amycolatopsis sp. NBC_01488 TaxID=2903563 RepID=UPI002E2AD08E|nr:helix-turn-helix domain-containing protein [Amycolatopsis sp. NBC_01488]
MSIEVINWALTRAPIPRDRRDASSLAVVLVGLANHADPDGRNAFPSLARLSRYTRLSERSVRYALRALEELDLAGLGQPTQLSSLLGYPAEVLGLRSGPWLESWIVLGQVAGDRAAIDQVADDRQHGRSELIKRRVLARHGSCDTGDDGQANPVLSRVVEQVVKVGLVGAA